MENTIILVVLALIALLAIGTLIKRAGRKGCCGSAGDYKPTKKKLNQVIATKIFVVDGMHCEKCANRVTEAVNDLSGAAAVVNLKAGTVTVSYAQEIPDAQIRARIERVGYTVTEVR